MLYEDLQRAYDNESPEDYEVEELTEDQKGEIAENWYYREMDRLSY